ncbi:MAG: ada [Alphaproteobacteria bacterium]|jgi:O-6-methylguanine DNA methyltransferase|nr:ada [Alphaproteobacteria bacterium]MDF3033486.1 ada [Alphaproteobacteria bacterium]
MKKTNNKIPSVREENLEDDDFDAFMKAVEEMDPEEARVMFQNIVATMEEEGEPIPFPMRLLTSDVLFGLTQTPVGLAYGISGLDQLMLTGFISEEDIEEMGDAETVLQTIIDDFEENLSTIITVRNDEAIRTMINSAIDGTYQVMDDVFEAMQATDLQRAVWKELTRIPYGETISYEELAKRVGKPKAVRAVASAVGENPISIAIPCHRIILKSGGIGEYHWGSDIKEKLLAYEQAKKQT